MNHIIVSALRDLRSEAQQITNKFDREATMKLIDSLEIKFLDNENIRRDEGWCDKHNL